MKYYAIIVGGGSGSRMETDIPKQFLPLCGKPVVMHTIEAFYHSQMKPEIILVLNLDHHNYWEKLCIKHSFTIPHLLIKGGTQRFHSVSNGLKSITGKAIVAIHDAVRPIISDQIITTSFKEAEEFGSAVTAVPSKDSIRLIDGSKSTSVNRDDVYIIQTPQTFNSDTIKKAYSQPFRKEFTDDASVVERGGMPIHLIPGNYSNIKITYPQDLAIAELLMNS